MLNVTTFVSVLTAIALFFGVAWTMTNFYTYYPVVQSAVMRVLTGRRTAEAAFVGTELLDELSSYPEIDVLVPGYEEQEVIHQSIRSIREAEYPQDKITLTVLLEPNDEATISRVESLRTEIDLDLVTVPADYPGSPNKPRALNYGFEITDADIVGVIDAENVVSTDLFTRVAKAIRIEDRDYVQGLVDMVNEDDGWKNLLFRAEYGYWYSVIVPAFKRLGFPIPLSGTTCFFKRSVLETVSEQRWERKGSPWTAADESWFDSRELSGLTPWDPNNVTEDFEIGLFLWLTDHEFGLIDAVTKEESPRTLDNWITQRTRWQKGKIYTFADFLRHPVGSSSDRGHLLWQSFLPHIGPLNIMGVTFLVIIGTAVQFVPELFLVVGVLSLSFAFLVAGLGSFGVGYWLVSTKPGGKKLLRTCIVVVTTPLYWVLQWGADVRAFKQFYVGNLDWEKTVHTDNGRLEALQEGTQGVNRSVREALGAVARNHVLLYPVLLLGLLLRVPNLDRSLWVDEIYSVTVRGSMNLFGLLTTSSDPHPPLYYLVLKGWMFVFGSSPVAVRLLSVLFGIGAIAAVYLLACELYDQRVGLIAALLMAVSTFQIQYAQTARMYSMLVFFGTLSTYFYVRTILDHTLDNRFGYVFTTLLMLLTHVYGGFVFLAQLLHLGGRLVAENRLTLKRWSVTQLCTGGLFVPWMALVAAPNYVFGDGTEVRWLSEPSLRTVRDILLAYAGVPINYPQITLTPAILSVGLLVSAGIGAAVGWQLYADRQADTQIRRAALLVALLLCMVVVPFALSTILLPLLEVRYTIVGFVAVAIILATTITDIPSEPAQIGAVVVVVLLFGAMIPAYYGGPPAENWDRATDSIETNLDDEALIVFNPDYTQDAVDYYLSDTSRAAVDTVAYGSNSTDRTLSERVTSGDYEQIWIVNIRSENLGAAQQSLPSNYGETRNETVGVIRLIEFRAHGSHPTESEH